MSKSLRTVFLVLMLILPGFSNSVVAAEQLLIDGEPELYSSCGGFIESPTFDPDGNLWLIDIPGDRILSVDSQGECVERGKSGGIPNGLLFHQDGRLFVGGSTGLLEFDIASSTSTVIVNTFEGEPLVGINDLVFDESGGLYFTASNNSDFFNPVGQVFYLDERSENLQLLTSKLAFPNGIALSANGAAVLVAEFAAKRIISLPTVGAGGFATILLHAYTEGGIGPDGMTVGDDGRLYVANLGSGRLQVFDNIGILLGTINLPDQAGMLTSNAVIKEDYLYITESEKGQIWRVKLND